MPLVLPKRSKSAARGAALLLVLLTGVQCFAPDTEQAAAAAESTNEAADVAANDLPELLAAAGGDAELAGKAAFSRALQQLRRNAHTEAMRSFDEVALNVPALADWAVYFAAWSAASNGDTLNAAQRVQELSESFRREYAWRVSVYAHEKSGDLPRAAALALAASQRIEGVRRYDATVEAARLFVAQGDSARGVTLLHPAADSASTPTRVKAATLLQDLPRLDSGHWLSIARALRAAGRGKDAIESYKSASTAIAKLERGQLLFLQRNYASAIVLLGGIARDSQSIAADALLLSARAKLRTGNTRSARIDLRHALAHTRAQPVTRAGAAFLLGDLAQDAGEQAEARTHFRRAIDAAPGSEPAAQAFMRLGIEAFTKGAPSHAAAIFDEFKAAHARTNFAQQAGYWSARARAGARLTAEARALMTEVHGLDNYSYYGLLAGEWLSAEPDMPVNGPVTPPAVRLQARGALRRAQLLRDLQLPEAASYEQERGRAHLRAQPGGWHALAEELIAEGRVSDAISIGHALRQRDGRWDARTLRLIYPFPYRETIERAARASGVNPYLVAALIRQESMFNPRAKSAAGALGLMQVMPKTGRAVAARIGLKRFTTRQLTEPEVNVRIGVAHFSNLMREYGNQLELVIASYNAGATPVARWRARDGHTDPQLFSERIPFAETREYVKILVRNMKMYELLYNSSARRNFST